MGGVGYIGSAVAGGNGLFDEFGAVGAGFFELGLELFDCRGVRVEGPKHGKRLQAALFASRVRNTENVSKRRSLALRSNSAAAALSSESLSGLPGFSGEGKTRPEPSRRLLACSSTSRVTSDKGTRCSLAVFVLVAGIRHSQASKSISSQTALRASPDRVAVNTTNRRHSLEAGDAPDL